MQDHHKSDPAPKLRKIKRESGDERETTKLFLKVEKINRHPRAVG
jgi:hypothetical protein